MEGHRKDRVGGVLQAFLAEEIIRLHDPRVKLVTITAIDMAPDLKVAWIYWTAPGDEPEEAREEDEEQDQGQDNQVTAVDSGGGPLNFPSQAKVQAISEALEDASGHLKKRVGEELKLRYVPKLNFKYDESLATGNRIDELLKQAGF